MEFYVNNLKNDLIFENKCVKILLLKRLKSFYPYSLKENGFYSQKEVKIMNQYESVIIINPSVEEQGIKDLVKEFTDLINQNGKVANVNELGKRKLAYEIKKNKEGYYVVLEFEAKPDSIAELERNYRINDNVIKFIVVKKED